MDKNERKMAKEKEGNGEQKFAAAANVILESMIDGVCVVDLNGNIVQGNTAFSKMFEYKESKEIIGTNITELITEREIPRIMDKFKVHFEIGAVVSLEFVARDKVGREYPVMINSTVMKDEKGKPIGTIAVLRDITEIKKTQEDLQKKVNELEEFSKIAVERELDMKKLEEELEKLKRK